MLESRYNEVARSAFRPAVLLKETPQSLKLYKKETQTQVFSCEICEIFKNTFFYGTPPIAASEYTQRCIHNPIKHLIWSFIVDVRQGFKCTTGTR